ncbi:MAG TPA: DUF58 domain-containing protein [Gammaproteobacteria bacterium]|nr:DUF58 domain-containing protein [Gammaproteobacteria bacterium]
MLSSARKFINRRAQVWARRRQGPDGDAVRLERRRVYILPTRQGLIYGFTVIVMLLGSMNYSNSMGFMLTFVLIGLGFVAMYACHANLTGLEIGAGRALPVFVGEIARFQLYITNPGRNPRIAISLNADTSDTIVTGDIAAAEHGSVSVPMAAQKRGWLKLERLVVETSYPFGLCRAWGWVYMNLRVLVYPKPAESAPPLPQASEGRGGGRPTDKGEEDFSGLRSYRPGDSPRHIAWKSSAREQKLLTKQFSGSGQESRWLDWDTLTGLDKEERLSVLCRWVLLAYAESLDYGLRLPGSTIPISGGEAHRDRCLEVLAVFAPDKQAS